MVPITMLAINGSFVPVNPGIPMFTKIANSMPATTVSYTHLLLKLLLYRLLLLLPDLLLYRLLLLLLNLLPHMLLSLIHI